MRQLKSGSLLILFLITLCEQIRSQQVINNVTIEKKSDKLYRVQYSFNQTPDFDIEKAVLKIYRRRNGNIEEIFSLPMSISTSNGQYKPLYSFDWTASNGIIQNGDELQAKVILSLKASAARQRLNRIPIADAGNFMQMELPINKPVILNGSKSKDEDGRITSIEWKQIGGPTSLDIQHKDSLVAYANGEFKSGTYAFELMVKDNLGAVSVSRTVLTVKEPSYWSTDRPVTNNPTQKNNVPQKTNTSPPVTPQKNRTKLKGGPSNAALSLLMPGLGHYFVSGNYNGENRKATSFILTAVYAGSVGGAFYFNARSNDQYKKYNDLANYRDYQKDANGVIIGVRGGNEAEADKYFTSAKSAHRNSLICLGVGGGVMVGDLIYTLVKGNKNRREWKRESTSFRPNLFISSNGYEITAGVKIKF
jgi:hypothetical protein